MNPNVDSNAEWFEADGESRHRGDRMIRWTPQLSIVHGIQVWLKQATFEISPVRYGPTGTHAVNVRYLGLAFPLQSAHPS
jgi:hypothetical protein